MATPESKLTGKTAEPAEQSASGGGAEQAASEDGSHKNAEMPAGEVAGGGAEQAYSGGGYKIRIPMYEGPLDLLLDLIKQQKMSVLDIRISEITAQYLDYLHKLEELDVDVSAEFIYMAATLIYIESKML